MAAMDSCRWIHRVEAYFDGEAADGQTAVEGHLASCGACAAYLAQLETLRGGVAAIQIRPEIGDAQFSAFFEGVRAGIEEPAPALVRWFRPLMAGFSLAAAALVIALSLFVLVSRPDHAPAVSAATEVEKYGTELSGASIDVQEDDGNVTLWLKNAPEHVWWE
jgi:anti-sigma factor RsiW